MKTVIINESEMQDNKINKTNTKSRALHNLDEILFIEDLEDTIAYLNDNGVKTIDVKDLK